MAFGIEWRTSAGKLAISSEAYGVAYIGNATYTGVSVQTGWSGDSTNGRIYTISSASRPVVFIQLLSNRYSVYRVVNAGSNVWHIYVAGTAWASPPVVKCFARLSGNVTGGYGIRVFDPNGNRNWDSDANMLVWKQKISWPSAGPNNTTATLTQSFSTSFASPYLLGGSGGQATRSTNLGGGFFSISDYTAAFSFSGGQVTRQSTGVVIDTYTEDASFGADNSLIATTTWLIDGSQYS